ncbi:Heterokaryon incompatibility protein [Hyphodiscus hymeniophilus]|uniref:Heterokaryon incompatibility protein n=1 Tax=Hyphodiscus hymeniophilus TaxID=353542 RepID=A0A9P6VMX4_9HELO|nr:Heterokaryon incompatibility protein [Hyphodiscus hymeniophilus]
MNTERHTLWCSHSMEVSPLFILKGSCDPYALWLWGHAETSIECSAGGYSEKQQRITGLSDPSLKINGKPFLVVYPQGVNNTEWEMKHIWKGAPYENKTVDDIGYVFDIISNVSSTYNVDRSRIYACGKSNGGGFTALLACRPDTSAVFAAFAPVSPALYQGSYSFYNCTPSGPKPILHSHGVEDVITPFHGRANPEIGRFGPEPDVRLWRRGWAERNGCKGRYEGEWPRSKVEEVHPGTWEEDEELSSPFVKPGSLPSAGQPDSLVLDRHFRPTSLMHHSSSHPVRRSKFRALCVILSKRQSKGFASQIMKDSDEYELDDDLAILERMPWLETPLDVSAPYIRILKLHPDGNDTPITCSLQVVSLDDHPDYETLSYVWGDSKKTKPITVGGAIFNATENLFEFLNCLRHRTTTRLLWADAICIDQSNNEERGRQIALMTRVYRQAKEALIWFGPFTPSWTEEIKGDDGGYIPACELTPDQWSQTENRCLRELSQFLKAGGKPQRDPEQRRLDASIMSQTLSVLDEVAGGKHFYEFPLFLASKENGNSKKDYVMNRHWLNINDCEHWILSRPWWTRVWTLQEAVLPQVDPIIYAHPHSFRLSRLLKGRAAILDHSNGCCKRVGRAFCAAYLRSGMVHETRVENVDHHRRRLAEPGQPFVPMEDAVDSARGRSAAAIEDYFFGFFGLLHPDVQKGWFEIFGYSCTPTETFSQCSKLIYDSTQSILGLGEARGVRESKLHDLPSWAIDLSAEIAFSSDGNQRWSLFNASLGSKYEGVDKWQKLAGGDLVVKAIPIGTVHACANRLSDYEEDLLDTPHGSSIILKHISEWQRLYTETAGSFDFDDKFWRTMFMDRHIRRYYMHERVPLPPSRLHDIRDWWENWSKTGDRRDTYIPEQYDDDTVGDFHYRAVKLNFEKHRFFCSVGGEPGTGPMETQAFDEIFVLQGCSAPAILRRQVRNDGKDGFSLVGLCFIDGWMYGKAARGRVDWKTLTLY